MIQILTLFCLVDENRKGIIIGVTNPFFFKEFDHWPHLVTIGPEATRRISRINSDGNRSIRTVNQYKNEVKTKYKAINQYESKQFLKQLRKGDDDLESQENNEVIRKYFHQLTEEFMTPLENFFLTLLPRDSDYSHFEQIPKIKPFREQEFLKKLIKSGLKVKNLEIYRSFIRCTNFVKWFRSKKKKSLRVIIKTYVQLFDIKNFDQIISDKTQKEINDLYELVNSQYSSLKKKKINIIQPR